MSDDAFIPTLTHATERDIDLLLVEELSVATDFLRFALEHSGLSAAQIVQWNVLHSRRRIQSRREIDIFVEMQRMDGTRAALLVENKLDATEQPDQAESYREELDVLSEDYASRAMILACPEAYAAQHPGFASKFDAVLTYETIRDWFRDRAAEDGEDRVARRRFRADLLDQAILKHRRGYTPVLDKTVGDFNARYVALLARVAPDIKPGPSMLRPANPRESTSMIFDQAATLSNLPLAIRPRRFAHEMGRGSSRRANYVAVTFAGWGRHLGRMEQGLLRDAADLGCWFEAKAPTKTRLNPGLLMKLASPPVDNQGDFDAQSTLIIEGMKVAGRMQAWLLGNPNVLRGWEDRVREEDGWTGR